jgi:hypothetical protein
MVCEVICMNEVEDSDYAVVYDKCDCGETELLVEQAVGYRMCWRREVIYGL